MVGCRDLHGTTIGTSWVAVVVDNDGVCCNNKVKAMGETEIWATGE